MNKRNLILLGLSSLLLAACGKFDPEQARQRMGLPPAGLQADAQLGKRMFQTQCSRCHGPDARGSRFGPSLLDATYLPNHHANLAFYQAVKQGVRQHHHRFGDMPPQPQVSPEQAGHIVAWIRQQQGRR